MKEKTSRNDIAVLSVALLAHTKYPTTMSHSYKERDARLEANIRE